MDLKLQKNFYKNGAGIIVLVFKKSTEGFIKIQMKLYLNIS